MSDQDPLDDFLKKKLSDRQYAFQDSYWEAAQELIEADRGKKKRKGFLIWWLGGLGVGVVILSLGLWQFVKNASNSSSFSYQQEIVGHVQVGTSKVDPDSCEDLIIVPNESSSHMSAPIASSLSHRPTNVPASPSSISSTQRPASSAIFSSVSPISDQRQKRPVKKKIPSQQSPISDYLTNEHPSLTEEKQTDIAQLDLGRVYRIQQRTFSLEQAIHSHSAFTSISSHQSPNYLGVRVALDVAEGWQNGTQTKAGRSYLPSFGIHYARSIRDRFRVHTGLAYQQMGNLQADKVYRSTNFGFGFETEATTISPQKLHFVQVPVYGEWRIRHRHFVLLGGSTAYLLNVSSLVSAQTETDFGIQPENGETVWGYKQGFRNMDLSLMAGYQYYLGNGLYLGLRTQYGLRDLSKSDFFDNNTIDRNLRIQLGLTFDFMNF
ncbi:MAG: hypothetical protein AAF587_31835 [Bacteroidota bacterium]